jgi:hypothetical protein
MDITGHSEAFWFVTMISNPARYASRPRLYKAFRDHVLNDLKANLLTVELMLGETDPHAVPIDADADLSINTIEQHHVDDREIHVLLRGDSIIWNKERALNIGMSRLPPQCRYVAWVDADITFLNPDIVRETVHQLQNFKVVQMFRNCIDMGPNGEVMQLHTSFGYCHAHRVPRPEAAAGKGKGKKAVGPCYGYEHASTASGDSRIPQVLFHSGYAHAAKRETLNALGGLFDVAILGSADHHMCMSMVGLGEKSVPEGIHPNYKQAVMNYQGLCDKHVCRRFGYVDGTIKHTFHGSKKARGYVDRWQILIKHQFDPYRDIKRSLNGAWEWATQDHELPHDVFLYFQSRNEDSVDA